MEPMTPTRNTWAFAQVVAVALLVNAIVLAMYMAPVHAEDQRPLRIVALGDSLTAGFGLPPGQGFPEQLQRALTARGYDVQVANAGVSGDTTSAGLQRLAWAIPDATDAVIVELGANDVLRGINPDTTRANLEKIVVSLKERDIPVLITGMRSLSNWGEDYTKSFEAIFPDLAREHDLILYPFFLDGVALDPALNQPDGLHPTGPGIAKIVERIMPSVEELIARAKSQRTAKSKS